ncbi:MAG: hypothetical protein CO029_03035 [Candidatus Magasanikbacteria bacterium CG_4_9_14_0_2_um_filter_41_10]|uniref:Uncharacterized protein n=1 Tax=Candidatus Magasanikbacteria bacterium CG_4_10_14_0_2_um_filter_41_31 TaxID=1974639 RepID=A0A2M7V254_9BACT|nr:MAG: hypothetical protein AUJ37_01055 [Candidatus Magasanikbacteria bacterium CG1_02_41_34]PIZ92503.1 MAG: hypothetical protein COX83_04140 [Candidatus Magasanikbacteria bacterium CG_4_10_14_0_2_um_filter_41_31]PJC53384.1 MAG: hypothetical protein CO029_03035 [Candidatus Magasanikbacteria bacterium CG_4_9_14_0_2_um_filter_41_10]
MFGGSGNIPSFVPNAFAEHRADVFYPYLSVDKISKRMYDDGAFLAIFFMGTRKTNNMLKAIARTASLKKQAVAQIKRDEKGPTIGKKLAEKMAGRSV